MGFGVLEFEVVDSINRFLLLLRFSMFCNDHPWLILKSQVMRMPFSS